MVGVAACLYAVTHLCLYVVDQKFDLVKVAAEIVSRLYLTIGFVALLGLVALAATSTDTMVRRIGGLNWRRLHQLSYVIGILVLIHYFQQTKADLTVPTLYAGLFVWLMCYRGFARWKGEATLNPLWLAAIAVVAAGLTLVGEAFGIALTFHISPLMILATAFDFDLGIRPAWWVLATGLAVAVLDLLRATTQGGPGRPRPAPPGGRASQANVAR